MVIALALAASIVASLYGALTLGFALHSAGVAA